MQNVINKLLLADSTVWIFIDLIYDLLSLLKTNTIAWTIILKNNNQFLSSEPSVFITV